MCPRRYPCCREWTVESPGQPGLAGAVSTSLKLSWVEWQVHLFSQLITSLLRGILGGQGGWNSEQGWRDAEGEDFGSG